MLRTAGGHAAPPRGSLLITQYRNVRRQIANRVVYIVVTLAPNVEVKDLTNLLLILGVRGSVPGPDTGYPEVFRVSPHTLRKILGK
jgi:hypothetical protein